MVVETEYSGVELCHKTMGFEDCRFGWLRSGSRERVKLAISLTVSLV